MCFYLSYTFCGRGHVYLLNTPCISQPHFLADRLGSCDECWPMTNEIWVKVMCVTFGLRPCCANLRGTRFYVAQLPGAGGLLTGKGICVRNIWTFIVLIYKFSSIAQSSPTLCDPMNCSTPGLPVHHQLLESTQTHVHWVGDAIQPSHPLSSPSPPAFNLSQHQSLFKWVSSSHQVAKVLEFQL